MNDSQNHSKTFEAFVSIFFIFAVITFLIFRYGTDKQTVSVDTDVVNQDDIKLAIQSENNSDLYNSYIDKIFENRNSSQKVSSENLAADFQNDLENKVLLPEFKSTLKDVGNYSANKYLNDIENLYSELKKSEGTEELKIFQNQITPEGTLLPLSGFDKEMLLKVASEYEIFADKIVGLSTPTFYQEKGESMANSAKKLSYILNKIVDEKDEKVYPMWINKYVEIQFDIIANRYAK